MRTIVPTLIVAALLLAASGDRMASGQKGRTRGRRRLQKRQYLYRQRRQSEGGSRRGQIRQCRLRRLKRRGEEIRRQRREGHRPERRDGRARPRRRALPFLRRRVPRDEPQPGRDDEPRRFSGQSQSARLEGQAGRVGDGSRLDRDVLEAARIPDPSGTWTRSPRTIRST